MKRTAIFLSLIVFLAPLFAPGDVTFPVCSTAVHDSYKATGPDGAQYATWHPQIDAKNVCHFDHEHGSNPAMFDATVKPLFGYTAGRMGMTEGHAGFKVYVIDDLNGRLWMILHHFGTANAPLAACTKHHTLDMAVKQSGVLVANVHFVGDFGKSVVNTTGAALAPAACPDQATDATGSTGIRQFPVVTHGSVGYEPWRVDSSHVHTALGFQSGDLTINTPNAQTACDTITCTQAIARTDINGTILANGTGRFVTFNGKAGGIGFTAVYSGTFYTDPMGMELRQPTDPDAVQQFQALGLNFRTPILPHCRAVDAQAYAYSCGANPNAAPWQYNPFVTGAN